MLRIAKIKYDHIHILVKINVFEFKMSSLHLAREISHSES